MKKYHWYSFCFMHKADGSIVTTSAFFGYPGKNISMKTIKDAKKNAGASDEAVMT